MKKILALGMVTVLALGMFTSCYDLAGMNDDPYALPDNRGEGGTTEQEDDSKYADINLTYAVSKADSAQCILSLQGIGGTLRSFLYDGYYADYQITTNLSHDIYSGYVANNQPKFDNGTPNFGYSDGWSSARWRHFYEERCTEYRTLLHAFKFNTTPGRYKNMFYITRIYFAFIMLSHTDTYGAMPFKVYAQARIPETNNVPYESQEEIYDGMFRMLEQAVDSIDPADASQFVIDTDDICYFGDANKWLRFANTLRLRMAMRLSNIDPTRAEKEARAALTNQYGLMTSNEDNMQTVPKYAPVAIGGLDEGGSENGLAMCSVAYGGESVLSWDLEQLYRNLSDNGAEYTIKVGRNGSRTEKIDPRCLVCWYRGNMTKNTLASGEESLREDFVGCHRGKQSPEISMSELKYSLTRTEPKPASKNLNPRFWFNYARPTVWMGYAESLFLQAEASLRGWGGSGNPETLFRQGVKASMDYYMIDPSVSNNYIDGLKVLNDGTFSSGDRERILEAIITQKWMAVFPNGNEGWAEFRRTDYPALETPASNVSGGDVPMGKNIKRILYPNSENSNLYYNEHPQLMEANSQGKRLWWDVADTNDDSGQRVKPNNFR